ncbi:exodeoxyribonuclease V subunit gamma [Neisseriaceae bacterium ESL0693]|nr:exodeoxyribonuclease V subunit gamma [Neisseriaceae bacterium ESL0693]
MLYVYQSNRLADLAALFARVYELSAPESPWLPTEIMVQSQGMRRYLNHYLAQQQGIAANLHFNLPASFAWQLTQRLLPGTPPLNPFQTEVMRWRLLELFQSDDFHRDDLTHVAQALNGYLNSSKQASYHLAGKLADIFDQYLIYRNDWLQSWQQNRLLNLGDDEVWQAQLWRWLSHQTQASHRVQQLQQLFERLTPADLPPRLFVFGIATLAPLYLQLLQAIARHTEVHLFAVNPSAEYWGNILSAQTLLRNGQTDLTSIGHPLLASLGKQGRDFFDALNELDNVHYMPSVYQESTDQPISLLQRLQQDIQSLHHPYQSPYAIQAMDHSIQLVCAHSRLRELHILKEQLLQDLASHPDWQPHDIAVLTPHIEPYLPFIEAVFGQSQGQMPALPYSIADIKISLHVPLLQLFEKLLLLMQSRFDIETILPLLDEPPLRSRFDLSDADVALISQIWQQQGIHWGTDGRMRHQFGGQGNPFTWRQAHERTVLGWLLPATTRQTLWQNHLPWFGDINHTTTIAHAQQCIDQLIQHYHIWQTEASVDEWLLRVRDLLRDLADEDSLCGTGMQQLETALAAWQSQAALAGFDQPIAPEIAIEHLQRQLATTRQAGFLRGGIVFCSMVPMRSLPFQCVCLLGLNDGEFPRTNPAAAFDLIAQHPRRGDRARRDDDRYLFLESLLSAQSKLYLSYIGRDQRKNDELAPSALLYELTDVLAAMSGCDPLEFNHKHIIQHPLQPFSVRYFNGELISCRQDYAEALNQTETTIVPFFNIPFTETTDTVQVDLEDFIRFWRNPVRQWLQQQLQWQSPFQSQQQTAAEPFTIEDNTAVYDHYLHARQHNQNFDQVTETLQASNLLPEGILGELASDILASQTKALDSTLLFSPAREHVFVSFKHQHIQLTGHLSQLHQHGQIIKRLQAPHAPDQIELYLRHLIFCAAAPRINDILIQTHELYPPKPRCLDTIAATEAQQLLSLWLDFYQLGQTRPLPFFARTSLQAAEKWYKNRHKNAHQPYGAEEMQAAINAYTNSHNTKPQAEYPEVMQIFGRQSESPLEQPLFWNLIEQLLLPLQSCFDQSQS